MFQYYLGFNGYIGGVNTKKDYRLTPLFLINYDSSLDGGTVRYTEKEKGKFKMDMAEKAEQLFQVKLEAPKKGLKNKF